MRSIKVHRKAWIFCSAGIMTALGLLVPTMVLGLTSAGAAGHSSIPARPHAVEAAAIRNTQAFPPVAFSQEFSKNTQYFCDGGSPNAPCDGNENNGDYGTIDRVAGGFTNGGYGNYAPSTPALDQSASTGGYMAVVSGDEVQNQGADCPSDETEFCTGPYALFGTGASKGVENQFPSGGFTVTADLYLSPDTAGPVGADNSNAYGQLVDADVGLNNHAGSYGIDEIITACYESGGFVINFGHSSPGPCDGTPQVTTDGWYRFVWVFTDNAGYAYLTEYVYSEGASLGLVASSTPEPVNGATATRIGAWGGPGYLWFPTEEFAGLPIANFDLQTGVHTKGKAA